MIWNTDKAQIGATLRGIGYGVAIGWAAAYYIGKVSIFVVVAAMTVYLFGMMLDSIARREAQMQHETDSC